MEADELYHVTSLSSRQPGLRLPFLCRFRSEPREVNVPALGTRIAAILLGPPIITAAVILSPEGRRTQTFEPPAGAMCNVDL